MSKVIGVAILLILGFAGWRFAAYYREVNRQIERRNNHRWEQTSPPAESPGMPSALEPLLAAAKTKGASEFKKWPGNTADMFKSRGCRRLSWIT